MLSLVDEAKNRVEQERPKSTYKEGSFGKALISTRLTFNIFVLTFSLKNKCVGVLNNEKRVFPDFFLKTFSLENKGFRVLNNEKVYFLIFFIDFFVEEQGF